MDKDRDAQVKAEIATGKDVKDEEDPDSLDANGDVPMIRQRIIPHCKTCYQSNQSQNNRKRRRRSSKENRT